MLYIVRDKFKIALSSRDDEMWRPPCFDIHRGFVPNVSVARTILPPRRSTTTAANSPSMCFGNSSPYLKYLDEMNIHEYSYSFVQRVSHTYFISYDILLL